VRLNRGPSPLNHAQLLLPRPLWEQQLKPRLHCLKHPPDCSLRLLHQYRHRLVHLGLHSSKLYRLSCPQVREVQHICKLLAALPAGVLDSKSRSQALANCYMFLGQQSSA
jgi:hypothetical protein